MTGRGEDERRSGADGRRGTVCAVVTLLLVVAGCGGSGLEGLAERDGAIGTDAQELDVAADTPPDLAPGDAAPDTTETDTLDPGPDAGPDADPDIDTGDGDVGPDGDDAAPSEDTADGPCRGEADGTACEDANACTETAECRSGLCVAVTARSCDDGNPCTDDRCDPRSGCIQTPNLATCDDGDPCTRDDVCRAGVCIGGGPTCDDDNPCTRDRCAADGACVHTPDDTLACEDGSDCTGGDFCSGGICVAGSLDGCDVGLPCRAATCAADGVSCEETDTDGTACDDGNACTSGDVCGGGACLSGGPLDCGWDPGCADFVCDAVDGCRLDALRVEGTPCEDGDRCTEGTSCDAVGRCLGGDAVDCEDGNTCTTNTCNPSTGCTFQTRPGEACDDGNACTDGDTCVGSSCRGSAIGCDDGDPCTLDRCDPRTGCSHAPVVCTGAGPCEVGRCAADGACVFDPIDGPCNDGRACTTGDTCVMGACVGLDLCDDGDPCTTDICDGEEGCVHVPFEGPCDDGDTCTSNEMCESDRICDGGAPLPVVDDGIACTDDLCTDDPAGRHVALASRCGDGEACSLDDGCVDASAVVSVRLVSLGGSFSALVVTVTADAAVALGGARVATGDGEARVSVDAPQAGPGSVVAIASPGTPADALELAAGEPLDAVLYLETPFPTVAAGDTVSLTSPGGRELASATAQ